MLYGSLFCLFYGPQSHWPGSLSVSLCLLPISFSHLSTKEFSHCFGCIITVPTFGFTPAGNWFLSYLHSSNCSERKSDYPTWLIHRKGYNLIYPEVLCPWGSVKSAMVQWWEMGGRRERQNYQVYNIAASRQGWDSSKIDVANATSRKALRSSVR